jgi:prepilin-type N-terminal cleavage/methylation domain-containing protein
VRRGPFIVELVRRCAFTIIELMMVVAIIALISAIAVPSFLQLQYRTKRTEMEQNVNALRVSEEAYHAGQDAWLDINIWLPAGPPVKQKRPWPSGTQYDLLGFRPDGELYGIYNAFTGWCRDLNIEAQENLDNLGGVQAYGCCVGQQHYFINEQSGNCGYLYGLQTY